MMESETTQTDQRSKFRTVLLIGILALLALGWGTLITQVPMLFLGTFPRFDLNRDSGTAILTLDNRGLFYQNSETTIPWSQKITFDVQSGAFDWTMSRDFDQLHLNFQTQRNRRKPRILSFDRNGKRLDDDQYRVLWPPEVGIADHVFEFPLPEIWVNNRFAVGTDPEHFLVMDFTGENSTIVKTKIGGTKVQGDLWAINDVDSFLRFQPITKATPATPPVLPVQHFTIDKDLAAIPGVAWNALGLRTSPHNSISMVGEHLVSINPGSFEIEFRNATDGTLTKSIPFPDNFDPVNMPCCFWGRYLEIDPTVGSPRFLNLKNQTWLFEGSNYRPVSELNGDLVLFQAWTNTEGYSYRVFDVQQKASVYSFDSRLYTDFICLLYTSPSPRDQRGSRMPSSA